MNDSILRQIVLKNIKDLKQHDFVIYGTGKIAEIYYEFLTEKFGEKSIVFFIDNKKHSDTFKNRNVYTIKELMKKENLNNYIYFLGTLSKIPLFIENLTSLKVDSTNIIYSCTSFSADYLEQNVSNIEKVILYPKFIDKEQLLLVVEEIINNIVIGTNSDNKVIFVANYNDILLPNGYFIVEEYSEKITDKDLVLVWDSKRILDEYLDSKKNVFCCDENFMVHLSQRMYMSISNKFSNRDNHEYFEISKCNYKSLEKKYEKIEYCVVCGMGPSLNVSLLEEQELMKNGIMIVCNNFVNLATDIKPDIYVLQDVDYLTIAKDIFDKIINYVKIYNIFLCVDIKWFPIILNNYEGLEKLLIGLNKLDEKINFINQENLAYRDYINVVPAMCIPVASGLKDIVYITGCDGGDSSSHWKHADGIVCSDLLYDRQYLKLGDNTFRNYSLEVNQIYKELFTYGENLGKHYIVLKDSAFDELHKRFVSLKSELLI